MGSTPIFCTLNFGPDDLNAGPFFLFKKNGVCVNGDGVSMGTVLYDTFFNKNVSYRTVPIDTPSPLAQTPRLCFLIVRRQDPAPAYHPYDDKAHRLYCKNKYSPDRTQNTSSDGKRRLLRLPASGPHSLLESPG